jgi:UDP-N-acetylmuramoylalanine-D-glutamate ligase
VLNADDPTVVTLGTRAHGRVIWYGQNPLPAAAAQDIMRSALWTVRDGSVGCAHAGEWRGVASIAELAGVLESGDADLSAALAAAALAQALRLPHTAIAGGLREFGRTPARIERLA